MKRSLSILGLVAATVLAAPLARAHTTFNCNGSPMLWVGAQPTFRISDISFPPGSTFDTRLRSMMSRWNGIGRSSFDFIVARDTDGTVGGGNFQNEVFFKSIDGAGGTLGVTRLLFSPCLFGAAIIEADVFFDIAESWSTLSNPSEAQILAATNFSLVAVHELGHALGLNHENDMLDTMNAFYGVGAFGSRRFIEPHADCRNGVRLIYPLSGSSIREYTISNWKRTGSTGSSGLISTPVSATRGSTITMQFTMENLGTTTNSPVVGHFLSTNTTISTSDIRIGTTSGLSMSRGTVRTVSVSVTIPSTVAPGVYFLGSIVDVNNTLVETNETDNDLAAPRSITIN